MRRIQLHLDDDVDNRLALEARQRGISKAAWIRHLIGAASTGPDGDPLTALIGKGDGAPVDDIDATVYGR